MTGCEHLVVCNAKKIRLDRTMTPNMVRKIRGEDE